MTNPYGWLPCPQRWLVLALLSAATLLLMVILTRQGKPLRTPAAPQGVVSFEFAWDSRQAGEILRSWNSILPTARRQIFIDFGFLIIYPLLLSLACAMLAEAPRNSLPVVGIFISWLVIAAGPLDFVENIALLRMIDNGPSEFPARLAGWCAGFKFLLVFAALGYLVLQGVAVLIAAMPAGARGDT